MPPGLADLEVHLTTAAVSYAQHMNAGRVNPSEVKKEIVIYPKAISPDTILDGIRKTQNLKAYLRLLAPHTQRYERLRQALAAYRRIEAAGGFTKVPDGAPIKVGGVDARISTIRQRLAQEGFLRGSGGGIAYDPALVDAIKQFQEQHGLPSEGLIGPSTIKQMNVSASDRVATLELNLERNRWLQNEFAPYHIFANLADQVVKLVKNDDTLHAEVIQVGQPYHQTPIFTDLMETIEIQSLLERSAVDRGQRVSAETAQKPRHPRGRKHQGTDQWRRHGFGNRGQLVEPRQGQFPLFAATGSGPGQRSWARQVPVPERVQRLHA